MGNQAFNPFSLVGKTILVTGASSGIGKAIAITCSRMGGTIVLTGRNEERLIETLHALSGEGHQFISADLTRTVEMQFMVDEVMDINFKSEVLLQAGLLS